MNKSNEAFRTISEVADELEIQKHVLRFWEVKFPQIKPMKRGGGRRYYRPEDVVLLRGIRHLLHAEGYTIKGVQKILRDKGVDEVKAYADAPAKAVRSAVPMKTRSSVAAAGRVRGLGKKRGKAGRPEVAAVIANAIRELQTCREALIAAGATQPAVAPARKAARAGR